tara:strand:+ start:48 stop:263 length:216 start_codon:yes stop_codon:yes gene_type:complete
MKIKRNMKNNGNNTKRDPSFALIKKKAIINPNTELIIEVIIDFSIYFDGWIATPAIIKLVSRFGKYLTNLS